MRVASGGYPKCLLHGFGHIHDLIICQNSTNVYPVLHLVFVHPKPDPLKIDYTFSRNVRIALKTGAFPPMTTWAFPRVVERVTKTLTTRTIRPLAPINAPPYNAAGTKLILPVLDVLWSSINPAIGVPERENGFYSISDISKGF